MKFNRKHKGRGSVTKRYQRSRVNAERIEKYRKKYATLPIMEMGRNIWLELEEEDKLTWTKIRKDRQPYKNY